MLLDLAAVRGGSHEEDLSSTLLWWLLVTFFVLLAVSFVVMLASALTSPYLIYSELVILLIALVGVDLLCMFILLVYKALTPERRRQHEQPAADLEEGEKRGMDIGAAVYKARREVRGGGRGERSANQYGGMPRIRLAGINVSVWS